MKQHVIWILEKHDGSQIMEIDNNGKETIFSKELLLKEKGNIKFACLKDLQNNILYTINLITGELILNGFPINVGKEVEGRVINLCGLPDTNYFEGLIQYKESFPVPYGPPVVAIPKSFNIGYKVDIPDHICNFWKNDKFVTIKKIMVLISVDSISLRACISTTFTANIKNNDGSETTVRF
ncbi:MAG: hypothetical protein M0P71_01475 [Melioribacteraceae bacterium]|nr:hypothetical protein [Melioribacteraceae bacterium]